MGSTTTSLANTAFPLALCPVTTRLIPMTLSDDDDRRAQLHRAAISFDVLTAFALTGAA
jgi:hypothetical protein